LTPQDVDEIGGLPSEAVCGQFDSDVLSPEHFLVNPVFVDFMHLFISTKGIELPSLMIAAKQQKDGYLYIIDFRTPDGIMGNVPTEDIIGAFQVKNGIIVKDSYWRNNLHKIYTKNGLVKLPSDLNIQFIDALKKIN
jgi:hypothetical protein